MSDEKKILILSKWRQEDRGLGLLILDLDSQADVLKETPEDWIIWYNPQIIKNKVRLSLLETIEDKSINE